MRRLLLCALTGLAAVACTEGGSRAPVSSSTGASGEGTATTGEAEGTSAGSGPGEQAWLEVGWGTTDFNAFEGTLPIVLGSQGSYMFSMPMRGGDFYIPPEPSFNNPEMPRLDAWVDVPGYTEDDGHLLSLENYVVLFFPSLHEPSILVSPAVWLVLPDGVTPEELAGLPAVLHASVHDAEGRHLEDEHELVIGDPP